MQIYLQFPFFFCNFAPKFKKIVYEPFFFDARDCY